MIPNIPGLEPVVNDLASAPSEIGGHGTRRTRVSRSRLYLRRFLRNRGAEVGLAVLVLLILFALFGSLLTTYSYLDVDCADVSSPPSPEHPFGTNGAGNDTYAPSRSRAGSTSRRSSSRPSISCWSCLRS